MSEEEKLRDQFAMAVLPVAMTLGADMDIGDAPSWGHFVAKVAYSVADAMVEVRLMPALDVKYKER